MTSSVILQSKKICLSRCCEAILLSVIMQFVLLTVFLLFVNFDIFHPIHWITSTFNLMISFHTWLCIVPLALAVVGYGILLGKILLAQRTYYKSRVVWIFRTSPIKTLFLSSHMTVGLLTAWLYSGFLSENYRKFLLLDDGQFIVNSRYVFLIFTGVSSGVYFHIKNNLKTERDVEFPPIQETKFVRTRSLLFSTIHNSLRRSIGPTIYITLIYWMLSSPIHKKLSVFFNAELDEMYNSLTAILLNFRLILYSLILCSHILSNMHLMQELFSIVLCEEKAFIIERSALAMRPSNEITLVEALAAKDVRIIQKIASLDLYNIGATSTPDRRLDIFNLSIPGGHPYNWSRLCGQCLSLIDEFAAELASSEKGAAVTKRMPLCMPLSPNMNVAADKILLRQYNDTFGIRRMTSLSPEPKRTSVQAKSTCDKLNEMVENTKKDVRALLLNIFYSVPGLFYLFGEEDGARTMHLLATSQQIVWVVQGLAGICASSLKEDKYGVVQMDLPKVIKSLLELKSQLDNLSNMNLNGRKEDNNLYALRNAVKRSLYRICTAFGDYLRDLVDNNEDLRHLQCFVNYQET